MMKQHIWLVAVGGILVLNAWACAAVYRVGPGQPNATVSAVAKSLQPGDLIELHGPITDAITFANDGTRERPIVIRGVGDQPVRIDFAGAKDGILAEGDHYVLENLELTGATFRGIRHHCDNLVVRGCYLHHNRNGIMGSDSTPSGDILIEYCEFEANGSGVYAHQMYLASWRPGATATVQFNYIHDGAGGANLKSRMPRNVIQYNWFESAGIKPLDLIDTDNGPRVVEETLLIGNVIIGQHRGNLYQFVNIGSDQPRSPGNNATFTLVNNLFVTVSDETRAVRGLGLIKEVRLFNNIFVRLDGNRFGAVVGVGGSSSIRTRLGAVTGSSNWVRADVKEVVTESDTGGVRVELTHTLRGLDPGLVDLSGLDFRLRGDSPCLLTGDTTAPCLPEFEPPVRKRLTVGTAKQRHSGRTIDLGPFETTPHEETESTDDSLE